MSAVDNRRITSLASERTLHRSFQWLHLHEPQLRRWQLEFLAIPAPPFHEAARAAWFLDRFAELGLSDPHIDAAGNVIAALQGSSTDACVLLSAHLDTVFPLGTACTPREDGPQIHCPGACDNGAGLTALLAIAAALRYAELTPATSLVFAANVGEEGEGDLRGMRHLFQYFPYQTRIATAISLEGSGSSTVVDRALGSRRLRVTLMGPGGHSWADAGRPNPILALASSLLSIANLPLPSNPRSTLNCGTIAGGTSVNSIPESASLDLDIRSTASIGLDHIEMAVLTCLQETLAIENRGVPEPLQLRLRVERIGERPAGTLPQDAPLARSLRAVDRHLGIATEPHIGSTDANLPLSLGVPALAIGAGGSGSGIHTLLESYDPTGRDLALRRILLLVLDACARVAGS